MMRDFTLRVSMAAGLLFTLSSYAAADIMHSDVNGASVWFTGISEGSPTGDSLPLYSQPFAAGDQLVFTPTASFSANSDSGEAADQTDGKLNLMIEAKPGAFIAEVDFEETGLVVLHAPFGGDAFTSVLALAELKVLEVNGAAVSAPTTAHLFNFAPNSSFLHSADAAGPSYGQSWIGSLSVTLPAMVTKLQVTVDNHLYASTVGIGTGALIDKKGFSIWITPDGTVTPNVPEPSTLALLALCMMTCVGRRR